MDTGTSDARSQDIGRPKKGQFLCATAWLPDVQIHAAIAKCRARPIIWPCLDFVCQGLPAAAAIVRQETIGHALGNKRRTFDSALARPHLAQTGKSASPALPIGRGGFPLYLCPRRRSVLMASNQTPAIEQHPRFGHPTPNLDLTHLCLVIQPILAAECR